MLFMMLSQRDSKERRAACHFRLVPVGKGLHATTRTYHVLLTFGTGTMLRMRDHMIFTHSHELIKSALCLQCTVRSCYGIQTWIFSRVL